MSQYEYVSINTNPGNFYTLLNTPYNNVILLLHIQTDVHSGDLQDEIFTEYEK